MDGQALGGAAAGSAPLGEQIRTASQFDGQRDGRDYRVWVGLTWGSQVLGAQLQKHGITPAPGLPSHVASAGVGVPSARLHSPMTWGPHVHEAQAQAEG